MLDFVDLNNTFKIKWIKECLKAPHSIWFFIPHSVFKDVGGLQFLLSCNYSISKLPVKLSKFYQQALLSWKLCHTHNFSPHKTIIWNNENITVRSKSIFRVNWVNKGFIYINDLYDREGNLLSYEQFMMLNSFPISFKEFNSVFKAIPTGISMLMRGHLGYQVVQNNNHLLMINGIHILSFECNNKHIRNTFFEKRKISPRGKSFWNSVFSEIVWPKAWLLPHKYCVTNKIKEVHIKILHNIYPSNAILSKFSDTGELCNFCNSCNETTLHLFCQCVHSSRFWRDLEQFIASYCNENTVLSSQAVLIYFEHKSQNIEFMVNLLILYGKFFIHKCKFAKTSPNFKAFICEFEKYIHTLTFVLNKKSIKTLTVYNEFFNKD